MAKRRKKRRQSRRPAERTQLVSLVRLTQLFAVLAGIVLVYEIAYGTQTLIYSTRIDQQDPFNCPFAIENHSHIFTVYNLRASCTIVDSDVGIANVRLGYLGSMIPALGPGHKANYKCPAKAEGTHFGKLDIEIDDEYEIYFMSLIPWSRAVQQPFHYVLLSDGSSQWLEGPTLR